MADFCTVADVASFLQREISDAGQVASCERAIAEATAAIRTGATRDRARRRRRGRLRRRPGSEEALPPELPVVSVASVIEDGVTLVEGAARIISSATMASSTGWARTGRAASRS